MTQQVVNVTEGTAVSRTLANFVALGVTCDNLTSSWLFLPDAGRYVPPWTASWSSPLVGTKSAVVQWTTPNGVVIPASGMGMANLTFTDYTVPYNPGVVVVQAAPTPGTGQAATSTNIPTVGTAAQIDISLAAAASTTILAAGSMKVGITGGFITVDAPGTSTAPVLVTTDVSGATTYAVASFQTNAFAIVPGIGVGKGDGGIKCTNGGNGTAFFRGTFTWL